MEPRKILIVESSRNMRTAYGLMLREYPLLFAGDGREAIERLGNHLDVDLVLTGLNPGHYTVVELLGELREKLPGEAPAVVVFSSEGRDEDTHRALEAGAAAYIHRPFLAEDLKAVIAALPPRHFPPSDDAE